MIEDEGFPGILLMETAGRKSAAFLLAAYPDAPGFVVLAGPGNNGGDGLVIARYLHLAGRKVSVVYSGNPKAFQGDAELAYRALQGSEVPEFQWPKRPRIFSDAVLVDALLGTGIDSGLRGSVAEMIRAYRIHPGPVVAIDLPSGLDANTGHALNQPLQAAHTLTFQLPKVCHAVTPAALACGEVKVLDIGIWPRIVEGLDIPRHWTGPQMAGQALKNRPSDGHKGSFGHVGVVGGSREYAGAVALAAHAALSAGAGLAGVFAPEVVRTALFAAGPEAMLVGRPGACLGPEDVNAWLEWADGKTLAIGPGLGQHPETVAFLDRVLDHLTAPVVVDADALNILAAHPEWLSRLPKGSILTPHPGEMARLLGTSTAEVQSHRLEVAEAFAREHGLVLVLKGAGTVVAHPGHTWVNATGNSGMGTAGAGDVLTGVVAALLAQGHTPEEAAWLGVALHGIAGDLAAQNVGQHATTASQILHHLGPAIQLTLRQHFTENPTV